MACNVFAVAIVPLQNTVCDIAMSPATICDNDIVTQDPYLTSKVHNNVGVGQVLEDVELLLKRARFAGVGSTCHGNLRIDTGP